MGFLEGFKNVASSVGGWFGKNGGSLASLAGTIGGNLLSYAENRALAQEQRDWMERMSNTAHQREVQDLLSAGLNPVLSANSGASVGSGAAGTVTSSDFGAAINNAKALAIQREIGESTVKKQNADARLSDNLATKADYETTLVQDQAAQQRYYVNYILPLQVEQMRNDIDNSKAITSARIGLMASQAGYFSNSARGLGYDNTYRKLQSDFYGSSFGRSLYYLDRGTNSAKGIGDAITSFIPKLGRLDFGKKYYDYSGDRTYMYDN